MNGEWCTTSLTFMLGYPDLTDNPKGVVKTYSGFQVQWAVDNMWYAVYSVSCLIECDPMYDLNNGAVYECYLCREKIPGCYICSSPTVCTTTCDAITPLCSDCDKSGTCLGCSGGFIVVNNTCQCQASTICLSCSNTTACNQCATGYYLNSGFCYTCASGCSACNSATNCTAC